MSNANVYELAMLDLINEERETAGLEPLRLITTLNAAAETHSGWMLDADVFSHDGEGGSSPSDRMAEAGYLFEGNSLALENIGWQSLRGAEGIEDDVAQVHDSLMNSPGHRANILNPEAEDIGIGIETGTFSVPGGDFDAVMVTQVFGSTDADISAWVDPGTGVEDEDPVVVEEEPVEDDLPIMDEEPMDEDPVEDPETDDVEDPDDGTDDDADDGEVVDVAEDDDPDDLADDDTEEDDVEEDDLDDDMPTEGDGAPVLPFELAQFTVDLRSAFEFTRDGDQLIWETSEDKLVEVFLEAIEDWAMIPPEEAMEDLEAMEEVDGDEGSEADIVDLMLDESPEETIDMGEDPEDDDMLLVCGL